MKIYLSGMAVPIEREFKRGVDVIGIQRTLAALVMGSRLVDRVRARKRWPDPRRYNQRFASWPK
jgi:hypothetical protein